MRTVIKHARVFDGDCHIFEDACVLFDEKGIIEISDREMVGEREIDGIGKTVLPGLFDCHVHLGQRTDIEPNEASVTALGVWQAIDVLRYGITSIRSCGTEYNADIHIRNMMTQCGFQGARIIASGRGITITGGHGWHMCHQCDTVEEIIKAARIQLREGADQIKIFATGGMATKGSIPNMPQMTEEEMHAAVVEAEKKGALTCAHATGQEGAVRAIKAGIHSVEHPQLDRESVQLMKKMGTYYCSTIVTRYGIIHCEDPRFEWLRKKAQPGDIERMMATIQYCKEYDVPMVAGTDAGFNEVITPMGSSLHKELWLYTEAGLTCEEALRTATWNAARMCKLENVTGTLKPGLAADIVLIDGNPLKDINDLAKVQMTFKGGKPVYVRC